MTPDHEKELVRLLALPDEDRNRGITIYVGQATYDLYQKMLHDYWDKFQFSKWYYDNYMTMNKLRKQIKDGNK